MLGQLFDIAYVEARKIWYFRWTATTLAAALFLIAAVVIYFIPSTFNAWGQVYMAKNTPLSSATEDLSFSEEKYGNSFLIEKILLNDQNLERLLKKIDPSFEGADKRNRELALAGLKSRIDIKTANEDGFIEFHVKDSDPVKARLVAWTLMDQFIADNMKLSRSDLTQASAFLSDQIVAYSQLLVESQAKLNSFRRQYPRIAAVTTSVGGGGGGDSVSLREAPAQFAVAGAAPARADTSALDEAIGDLERRVAGLLTQYTEQYPDVIAARRQIATLQAQRAAAVNAAVAAAAASPAPPAQVAAATAAAAPRRYVRVPVRTQGAAPAPIAPPDLAAQWAALRRENELLADNYQTLVGRREAAKMSLAVYSSDAPGKFQITREPTVPSFPIGPNRPLFLAIAALVAIVAGLAVAYLRAAITGIFVSSRELEDAFHLPVVGTVSWEPAWHTGATDNKPALPFLGKGGPHASALTRLIAR